MSFGEALKNKPVQKYNTKMTRLLDALPGEEADALDLLLQDGTRGHTYISKVIADEAVNYPEIDQRLFSISDKSIAKYRDDAARLVTGL